MLPDFDVCGVNRWMRPQMFCATLIGSCGQQRNQKDLIKETTSTRPGRIDSGIPHFHFQSAFNFPLLRFIDFDDFWPFWTEIGQNFPYFDTRFNGFGFQLIKFWYYCENWWFSRPFWPFWPFLTILNCNWSDFSLFSH